MRFTEPYLINLYWILQVNKDKNTENMLSIVIFFNFKLHKKKCVEKYKFTERCQLGAPLYLLFKQFFIKFIWLFRNKRNSTQKRDVLPRKFFAVTWKVGYRLIMWFWLLKLCHRIVIYLEHHNFEELVHQHFFYIKVVLVKIWQFS